MSDGHKDKELSFIEHLSELRKRILIALAAFVSGTILSFPFSSRALKILKLPGQGLIEKLVFFSPQEGFMIYMRIAFLCGLIISMPVILYQVWAFIFPALEDKAKRHAGLFIFFCSVSFAVGCLFAYFVLIPPALKFLLTFASDELEPMISADKYISFITGLILACGLVFQMPIVSAILTKAGVINAQFLRKKYKYAFVIIFIAAAIITPTSDAFNMLMLAVPMLILYELSIFSSWLARRKK